MERCGAGGLMTQRRKGHKGVIVLRLCQKVIDTGEGCGLAALSPVWLRRSSC